MKRFLCLLLLTAGVMPAPTFNLTPTELEILTSWLYEPIGYLDVACRVSDGQCARQAWEQNNSIDVTQWVRDNPQGSPAVSTETAMVWWIRANDQINIPRPQRPPEAAAWVAILQGWDASISAGLARAPASFRNQRSQSTYTQTSCPVGYTGDDEQTVCVVTGSIPSGAHLSAQQRMISAVLSVLQ